MLRAGNQWDPMLIISQIITLQCAFYVVLGIVLLVFSLFAAEALNLDQFFDYTSMSIKSPIGIATILAYPAACTLSTLLLIFIVERAKKCLDFVATLFIVHLVLCIVYSGFPMSLTWWITISISALIMTLLGEYLCMRHEMREIHLSTANVTSVV
jgi:protein SYS1